LNNHILVLCDTEEEYAGLMSEYLKGRRETSWEIRTYTDIDSLLGYAEQTGIDLLVIAENAYQEKVRGLTAKKTILLNESGVIRWENIRNISKYQAAEEVYKEILSEYMELHEAPLPRLAEENTDRLIGFFTPVHRSLQTTFALTMGQLLAEKHKTLYLNFEYCAGMAELLPDTRTRDLADLVYFLNTDKDRFWLRMQTMLLKKGEMDFIPPVKSGNALLEIKAEEWEELLMRIRQMGEYEFIILDLSESVQGLPELLRACSRIFTLTRDDRYARGKLAQYERMMALGEYEDILSKSSRYKLPHFRRIPDEIELYTKGDLAEYVNRVIGEVMS